MDTRFETIVTSPAPVDPTAAPALTAQQIIPGAFERRAPAPRAPGAIGGSGFGTADLPEGASSMAPATIAEREKEGGGGLSQRPAASKRER